MQTSSQLDEDVIQAVDLLSTTTAVPPAPTARAPCKPHPKLTRSLAPVPAPHILPGPAPVLAPPSPKGPPPSVKPQGTVGTASSSSRQVRPPSVPPLPPPPPPKLRRVSGSQPAKAPPKCPPKAPVPAVAAGAPGKIISSLLAETRTGWRFLEAGEWPIFDIHGPTQLQLENRNCLDTGCTAPCM